MKCPICGNEMEKGRVNASGGRSMWGTVLNWYKEEDCNRPFLKKPFLYAKCSYIFSCFNTRKDFPTGYFCSRCQKIVAILDANSSDDYPENDTDADSDYTDAEVSPQAVCSKCGKSYDCDYPECPYCNRITKKLWL